MNDQRIGPQSSKDHVSDEEEYFEEKIDKEAKYKGPSISARDIKLPQGVTQNSMPQLKAMTSLKSHRRVTTIQANTNKPTLPRRIADQTQYFIDSLIDHDTDEDHGMLYKVHWYGFPLEDATWRPISGMPQSKVLR